MKTNEVAEKLGTEHVKQRKGVFTYWKSYYWGFTKAGEACDKMAKLIKEKIPTVVILDSGNHFAAFNGGAKSGSAKDSYFWVTFTVPETTTTRSEAMLPIGCLTNDGKLVARP